MPRKKTKSLVREVTPDRLYNNETVTRLINRVMLNGKKQLAERLVYSGMQKAADKLKVENPLEVFEQAVGADLNGLIFTGSLLNIYFNSC